MDPPNAQPRPEPDTPPEPRNRHDGLAAAPAAARTVAVQAPVNLLVAASEDSTRRRIASMLGHGGYTVARAATGAEAFARLAKVPFDILLCGHSLCGEGGTPFWQEVRGIHPYLGVILIGHHDAEEIFDETRTWTNEVVGPRCGHGELAIAVQRTLTRAGLQRRHSHRYRAALESSSESVLDALLTALNTRDTETQGHTERVTAYTMEIMDRMGVDAEQQYHIERGALLHDIGKIGIPDRILHKCAKLTDTEWSEMRKHPIIGYQMCVKVDMLRVAAEVVLRHHEKWDGTGYPDGLVGEAIPLGARIVAVADALDAITSDRPFRTARPFSSAREELVRGCGTHFDPEVVRVFLSIPEARWGVLRANAAR